MFLSLSLKRLHFYYALLIVYLFFQISLLNFLNKFDEDTGSNAFKILEFYKNLSAQLNKELHLDNTGKYKIFNLKHSVDTKSNFDITLVSQCSSNHIYLIDKLCDAWPGPISVAVYTDVDHVERTLWDMAKLLHCNKAKNIKLQLVLPAQNVYIRDFKYAINIVYESDRSISCQFPQATYQAKNYNRTLPYPINLLRNVAKSESSTDYIMIIDIDMVPNLKLRDNFLNFASSLQLNSKKIVYVVPVFEVQTDAPIPENKNELIALVKEKKARPFYFVPCRSCQKYTGYNKWLMSQNVSGLHILYSVEWKHPWEPFFIAENNIPNFDERFKQYGLNRVSQICELHIAGYKFYVLDNAFLIHRGFKTIGDFHDSKDADMGINRNLYARFKDELKFKYPNSKGKC